MWKDAFIFSHFENSLFKFLVAILVASQRYVSEVSSCSSATFFCMISGPREGQSKPLVVFISTQVSQMTLRMLVLKPGTCNYVRVFHWWNARQFDGGVGAVVNQHWGEGGEGLSLHRSLMINPQRLHTAGLVPWIRQLVPFCLVGQGIVPLATFPNTW